MFGKLKIEAISPSIVFNNGAFNVRLNTQGLLEFLKNMGASQKALVLISSKLVKLGQEMTRQKEQGIALGSTMPEEAILDGGEIQSLVGYDITGKDISRFISKRLTREPPLS